MFFFKHIRLLRQQEACESYVCKRGSRGEQMKAKTMYAFAAWTEMSQCIGRGIPPARVPMSFSYYCQL